jgi:outer membrane lipoprotein-sorting protein
MGEKHVTISGLFFRTQSSAIGFFMRRLLAPLLGAFALGCSLAVASDMPAIAAAFTGRQQADLMRVASYLQSISSVQGSFLQVAGNGTSQRGTFYIKKPGRVRFEYMKPNPTLVISDGTTVAVENTELHTTDRYPLANSPLRLLLSGNPDLVNDPRIAAVKEEPGILSVTAREESGPAQGSITLTFADSGSNSGADGGLELRQWEVTDAQGQRTTVVVNDMRQVADLPAKLFIIQDLSPFKKQNG